MVLLEDTFSELVESFLNGNRNTVASEVFAMSANDKDAFIEYVKFDDGHSESFKLDFISFLLHRA